MPTKKLKPYHSKRDFDKTPEPKGRAKSKGRIFVIQRHNASHLHYDLRLEVNGVLRSWAVPKGMPRTYAEKHLAIQTEDHPLEYAKFEGTIPKGQYGGGTVKIWDTGDYELLDKINKPKQTANAAIKAGIIKFHLNGKRLHANYALIKFKKEQNKNQWLLLKLRPNHE